MIYKSFCILCASSFPFLFSLHGDFVFDDAEAIVKNKDVVSESWIDAFYNDFWGTNIKSNLSHKSYRPMTILSFRINYFINNERLNAVHFKVTNLLFHVICCFILWQTFDCILSDLNIRKRKKWQNDLAYLATLIFAVHPIHVEAVCGVVGRADVMAANTFFLALLVYKKAMKNSNVVGVHLFIVVLLACTSMLFKENGVTVLGFCLCYEVIINWMDLNKTVSKKGQSNLINLNKTSLLRMLFIIVAIILLLYGRWILMGGTKPEFKPIDNPAAFTHNEFAKIATYNYIYFLNLLLLLWPQWLCYDWSMGCVPLMNDILDLRMLFILLMYIYAVLFILAMWRKTNRESTKRLIMLAILLAVIPFLPASNIFYPVGFVLAERILYIPSAGYCLLITVGFHKIFKREKGKRYKISTISFCFLILTLGLRSWQRSEEWRSEYQLFVSGLSVCPLNAKVHYNVAKAADAQHNTTWALEEYKEAIRLHPNYYQAMNNLANLLKTQKQYAEAEFYLRKAVGIKRDFPAAWMNLGIVLSHLKRYEESEMAYNTALEYRKVYPDCLYNLGNLFLEMNKIDDAMEYWIRAVSLNSTHVLAWTNLLALLDNTGRFGTALEVIPKALAVLPESPSVNFAIANVYGKMDRYVEAEIHFKKAIRLFENKVQPIHYANLGVLYHRWKKYQLAEEMYKNALKIDPLFKSAQRNLESLRKLSSK